MVKGLLLLAGLAILLISSQQMFLMFRDASFRARGNRLIARSAPLNLFDEFSWARAFRRCRRGVDLLAVVCLMRPTCLASRFGLIGPAPMSVGKTGSCRPTAQMTRLPPSGHAADEAVSLNGLVRGRSRSLVLWFYRT